MRTQSGKRQAQAAARREQLLRIALDLFVAHGFRGTSVRDIARAAGVNEGLLYHYFISKAELFAAVLTRYAPFESSTEILESAGNRSISDVFGVLGRRFLSTMGERRALVVTILSEGPTDSELGPILGDFLQKTRKRVTEFLIDRQTVGEVNQRVDCEAAAQAFLGGLLFEVISAVLLPEDAGRPRHEAVIVDRLVAILLAGVIDTAQPSG